MLRHVRTGIAVALLFTSVLAAGALILNPRFVDDVILGTLVFLIVPMLGGAVFGPVAGHWLDRLGALGSSEAPLRASNLLWAAISAVLGFFTVLVFLPSYLGIFTNSETLRYGGALLGALGFGWVAVKLATTVAERPRFWIWPALAVLPLAVVLAGSPAWRGQGPASKMVVLAFPGLSWNVAEDLVDNGEMPHLAELRRTGAWGELHSVKDVSRPAVWTSIATGKHFDAHGVSGYHATAGEVRSRRIWEILEQRGWSIGVFGWPVTWPPREVDGFIVPAVGDPGSETYPVDLRFIRELAMREKTGQDRSWGIYCRFTFLGIRYGARLSTLLDASRELLLDPLRGRELDAARLFAKRKLRAQMNCDYFVELRRRSPVDFAAFHSNLIHIAQAHFWKYHEPTSFEAISSEDVDLYGESVHDAYRMADEFIGHVLGDTGPNDLVVVVSDHGAEALADPDQRFTLRVEPMLKQMRLKSAVEATNVASRTYLRVRPGHEGSEDRIKRLFEAARLDRSGDPVFDARLDEWGNVEVKVRPEIAGAMDEILLFQGGRCPVDEVVRPLELQESAKVRETGALVLNGEGVRPGQRFADCDLFDFVPTLLRLNGLDLAADLPGDLIAGALEPSLLEEIPGMVATYDTPAPNPSN